MLTLSISRSASSAQVKFCAGKRFILSINSSQSADHAGLKLQLSDRLQRALAQCSKHSQELWNSTLNSALIAIKRPWVENMSFSNHNPCLQSFRSSPMYIPSINESRSSVVIPAWKLIHTQLALFNVTPASLWLAERYYHYKSGLPLGSERPHTVRTWTTFQISFIFGHPKDQHQWH